VEEEEGTDTGASLYRRYAAEAQQGGRAMHVEHQGEQEDPLACFDDELRDDGRAVEEETVLELEPAADAQCEGDITLLFDRERKGADDFARWQSGRRQLNDLQMGLLNESLLESEPVTASQQLEATYDGPMLPPSHRCSGPPRMPKRFMRRRVLHATLPRHQQARPSQRSFLTAASLGGRTSS